MSSAISHKKESYRFQSNSRLFERYRTFCLACLGIPVTKKVPQHIEHFIVQEFATTLKKLDAIEAENADTLHQ
jgi:hypothetical protein